ncbi:MAG: SLC13 family permease [Verrucomicrobiales bacterium]
MSCNQEDADGATHSTVRQRAGLFIGPALLLLLWAIPMPGLKPEAHRLAGIMALVVVFWVTEAIPLAATALLVPVLSILCGVAADKKVFAPFASPITFLFIGSFMLAEAMQKYGLERRLALRLLSVPALGCTPGRLFATLGILTAGLSMWMSNSATTAMMLPIALAAARTWSGFDSQPGARASLVLLIAFAASIGGQGTPVGTPPNLIGLGAINAMLGIRISFFEWMLFGVPLAVVQMAFLLWLLRPDPGGKRERAPAHMDLVSKRRALGAMSPGEKVTVGVFALTVTLWIVPGLIALFTGSDSGASKLLRAHVPEETVGLLSGVLLLITPVSWREGKFALTWREAAGIDWGTILIFGGGMALGTLLFDTGLAEAAGRGVIAAFGQPSLWTLTAVGIVLSIAMSEAASNTASATVMVPSMIAIAKAAEVNPVPVALATCLACSFGFLLPVSTPPNALAYATGQVTINQMIRRGAVLDVVGAITIFIIIRIAAPLMGWT